MNNNNKPARFTHFDELLAVRMAAPEFQLGDSGALPESSCETTKIFIDDLLELGFIFSHELTLKNAVGKDEGEQASMLVYMNTNENSYALITDIYHDDNWVLFTSFFADGTRYITTSQPGAMGISAVGLTQLHIQNAGSAPLHSQWKKHKRHVAQEVPETMPVLFKPEQHVTAEEGYYAEFVSQLLDNNVLHQSDTQTVRFTRSGARTFHLALTSRSARRPKPKVEEWIGNAANYRLKK